jgi:hypothetical protein
MITVYHTSYAEIPKPDVLHSRRYLDFGKGFYVTQLREQAVRYGEKFIRNHKAAYLNEYQFDSDNLNFRCRRFENYDAEWLDFVTACRRGDTNADFDIIEGGIANDRVFNTVDLFFQGLITKEDTISRLRYEKPNWQICFLTQRVIDCCLTFVRAEKLS